MNACLTTTGLMQQIHRLFGVLVLLIISCQMAAYAAPVVDGKKVLRTIATVKRADTGVVVVPLEPRAEPYALKAGSGEVKVRFSVRTTGKAKSATTVFLRRKGDKESIPMNDQGKTGDLVAKDGIYGVNILLDASKLKPDTCQKYEAFIKRGRAEVVSTPLSFCVSSFPVRIASSNKDKPAVLSDGTKAVADEVMVTTKENIKSAAIRRLASDINATVVGSIPQMNLYQLRLSSPASSSQLLELVAKLNARTEVKDASVNAIGTYAVEPFPLLAEYNSLHGLKLIRAQDVWGAGAIGSGVTVAILDSGLDKTHPDFGTSPLNCQLAEDDCGAASTDTFGHGTQVAGVVAAKSNGSGMVGVAYGSKIHSIKVSATAPSLPEMMQGFVDADAYGVASVINASFDVYVSPGTNVSGLCNRINTAVLNGTTAVAVVVNAAGNSSSNDYYYPGRCNVNDMVNHIGQHEMLTRKDLFITVANSTSGGACATVDQLYSTSNFGAWVDIAAPGCDIYTTTRVVAGSYANVTGTSLSAPMVSGAAAILASCGVPLGDTVLLPPSHDGIEYVLKNSTAVTGGFSGGRLDIYHALQTLAPTATNLSAAENYTEDLPLNLIDIVISSNLSACATITATLTFPAGAGSLASGGNVSAAGVWTVSGTVANVNTALAALTFTPTPSYSSNFNITTSVSDGISTINGTKVMTGIAVNSPPVNTVPAPQAATEDIDKVISGISVFDVDAGAAVIRMTLTATHGTIGVNAAVAGGVPAANITGNNTASIILNGSQSQINATLANATGVTYHPATNYNGPAMLTVFTDDNGASGGPAQTDNDVINITVAAVNDPPDTAAALGSGMEDTSPITVSLSGSDIDGTVVSFNIVSVPSNGTLYSDAAMTTLVGGSVAAAGNAATVYFKLNANFNGTDTFTYASVDNLGLADATPATATINVTPANDAPVNTVPAAQTAAEGIAKVIGGISVFDADAGATAINMTLTATNGTISVNMVVAGGVPAANITGNNTASIILTGSQSQINATLANATGVTYTASLSGGASLTVMTNDGGASGGSAQSDTDVINITVSAGNHAPTATNMNAPQSYTEDVVLNLTGIVVTDADVGDVITAILSLSDLTAGTLSSGAVNSVGGVWSTSGSVASINTLLAGLTFAPSANFNSNFSISTSVSDGIAPAITGSKMMTGIPVSDIPTGAVGIDGTRKKGFTLNAITIGIANPDGWSASYQWRRSDTPVAPPLPVDISLNGTNSAYILVQDDVDKYMSVCVTYTSGVLTPVTICSGTDATAIGDPHINTVDGLHYDFQSAGEFVALRGSDGMEIQVRQTPVSTAAPLADSYSMLPVGVSVNTAVAARVGKHSVTYQMKDNANSVSSGLELKVDHDVVTATADGFDLGSGGRVASVPGNGIQIDFPDGTTMIATPYWWAWNNVWYMDVSVMHTSAYNGIMGARYKGSWLPRLSDGSALGAMPAAMHDRYVELYVKFADSWRVNDDTSLFDYAPDTSTKTFTFKEWPKEKGPYVIGNGPVAKPVKRQIAQQLCRGVVGKNDNADCVFDVMVTGNRGIAKSHLLSQQIRTGLTSINVRDDRGISRDKEMVTFTATVARHAAITRKEFVGKGGKGVPTGAVQFTMNGNNVGRPVKLDARGQAQLKMPRLKIEKQTIGAKYIPVKGGLFFPSSSRQLTREFKPLR